MTRLLTLTAALALMLGLAACATPQYAARAGYTPRPDATPQYPIRPQAATPPAPAPPPRPQAEEGAPVAAPSGVVEAHALSAPASAAPASASAAMEPAASDGASAGEPERPMEPQHVQPASPPQPAAAPPAPMPVPAPARAAVEPDLRGPVRQAPRSAVTGRVVSGGDVFFDYQVSKGDHVDALAREYGTSRKVIVDTNHLKPPYGLRPGQVIKLPVAKAYVVDGGDTLALVARRFGVTVGELAELNHISARAALRPGQKLGLPPSFSDHGPVRLAGTVEMPPPRRPTPVAPTPQPYAPAERHAEATPPTGPGLHPYVPSAPTPSPTPSYRVTPIPARPQIPDTAPPLSDTQVAQSGQGRFIWPLKGDVISGFGVKGVGRRNDGLDIRAAQGTVVHAAAAGDVVYAGDQVPGFGNLVLVKHADGWVTAYAHLDKIAVAMRQPVTQGQELGAVGVSGGVTEPQLHFEVRYAPNPTDKAKPVDPTLVLPRG